MIRAILYVVFFALGFVLAKSFEKETDDDGTD